MTTFAEFKAKKYDYGDAGLANFRLIPGMGALVWKEPTCPCGCGKKATSLWGETKHDQRMWMLLKKWYFGDTADTDKLRFCMYYRRHPVTLPLTNTSLYGMVRGGIPGKIAASDAAAVGSAYRDYIEWLCALVGDSDEYRRKFFDQGFAIVEHRRKVPLYGMLFGGAQDWDNPQKSVTPVLGKSYRPTMPRDLQAEMSLMNGGQVLSEPETIKTRTTGSTRAWFNQKLLEMGLGESSVAAQRLHL